MHDGPLPPSPASLRATLAGIDAELAALRARVEDLAAERRPIVKALKAIVYPILTVPVEITAEIFLQCVDWAEISTHWRQSLCAPLVLASVCKQWRAVALDLHPIWSRLQIFNLRFHETSKLEELLAWWVPRAGGRLLEVNMPKSDGDTVTALIPHSLRLKSLTCDFSSRLRYPPGLATIQRRIPHLETLRVELARGPVPTEMLAVFSEAPLLREAHITGLAFELFILPWGQLTTLGLGGDFVATYAEILQHTPQLQVLHLERGRGGYDESVPPQAALTLHHLHTLILHCDDEGQEQADALLDALTLPALRKLDLGAFPYEFEDEVGALLTRSSCPLVSISFGSHPLYLPSTILKAAGTPSEVHMTDIDWTPREFESFFRRMHGSLELLPNLRTLSMSSRLVDVPYTAMAEMVASRQGSEEGCARLESFQFKLPQLTLVDANAFAMFETLIAQGCRVEIQGLEGFNMGLNADSSAAHSYTLENPLRIL
ncbi:hypothetical protein C8R46DRAFT_1354210 [Mycena filopes]|nr:hypothetical protein C8R46DRAFT_1354210 [Mycena filopes]